MYCWANQSVCTPSLVGNTVARPIWLRSKIYRKWGNIIFKFEGKLLFWNFGSEQNWDSFGISISMFWRNSDRRSCLSMIYILISAAQWSTHSWPYIYTYPFPFYPFQLGPKPVWPTSWTQNSLMMLMVPCKNDILHGNRKWNYHQVVIYMQYCTLKQRQQQTKLG